jgi:hypothetical protein
MRLSRKVGVAALFFGLLSAIFLFNRPREVTEIKGHVFSGFKKYVGPVGPVSGAVVSNDWDSTTSTTDDSGYFRLALTKKVAADEFVVLTVKSGDTVVRQPMIGYNTHIDGLEIVLTHAK